jgi:hypothetical protein
MNGGRHAASHGADCRRFVGRTAAGPFGVSSTLIYQVDAHIDLNIALILSGMVMNLLLVVGI